MRTVLLIAEGADGDAAEEWLESLPEVTVERHSTSLPLKHETPDIVWIHGPARSPEGLRPWLEQGGRLLATLDAVVIPGTLGLETVPPDETVSPPRTSSGSKSTDRSRPVRRDADWVGSARIRCSPASARVPTPGHQASGSPLSGSPTIAGGRRQDWWLPLSVHSFT